MLCMLLLMLSLLLLLQIVAFECSMCETMDGGLKGDGIEESAERVCESGVAGCSLQVCAREHRLEKVYLLAHARGCLGRVTLHHVPMMKHVINLRGDPMMIWRDPIG